MKWYPWLRPAYEKLVESYQAGRGHHALLIQALPGMGDEALCYALSVICYASSLRATKAVGIAVAVSLCRLARIRTITR
ncbi:DNA polymerase III subunit delta' [Salmonella enterica subsp. enterica]|nr:DNA polymerase III subunit delta' [Salmonella enterica subsp. enterica]